jgi:hypothetical protein
MDPVELQVLTGALHSICEEMGAVLIRSAHSANIKERRDCSTALFSPAGEMVTQAEHIPVHLGAMPAAVASVLDEDHVPGRSWILNDPYRGGTHLPDITVITPIFAPGDPSDHSDHSDHRDSARVARPLRPRAQANRWQRVQRAIDGKSWVHGLAIDGTVGQTRVMPSMARKRSAYGCHRWHGWRRQ